MRIKNDCWIKKKKRLERQLLTPRALPAHDISRKRWWLDGIGSTVR